MTGTDDGLTRATLTDRKSATLVLPVSDDVFRPLLINLFVVVCPRHPPQRSGKSKPLERTAADPRVPCRGTTIGSQRPEEGSFPFHRDRGEESGAPPKARLGPRGMIMYKETCDEDLVASRGRSSRGSGRPFRGPRSFRSDGPSRTCRAADPWRGQEENPRLDPR